MIADDWDVITYVEKIIPARATSGRLLKK